MTDVFGAQAEPASPIPATQDLSSPAAPAAAPAAPARTEFDTQLDDFLGRDLMAEYDNAGQVGDPTPAAPAAAPAAPAAAPNPIPAPANGGTPPANNDAGAPAGVTATDEVDTNDLFSLMSGAAPAQPAPAPTPAAPAATPSAPADEAPPAPFGMDMQLPQQLVTALFESEDPVQRTQALTGLMAALGNAAVAVIENRIASHHTPRMVQQFESAQAARNHAAQVNAHFYQANADLQPYQEIVKRAGEVYLQRNPTATYNEETAKAIAALARAGLRQMGKLPAAPAAAPQSAAPALAAPQGSAPPTPYMAGGASPGGALDSPGDRNDPGSIFDQMTGGF